MDFHAPVSSIMTSDPITIEADRKLAVVQEIFDQHKVHHLPVVQKGKLVGMISKTDLLYFLKGVSRERYQDISMKFICRNTLPGIL